MAGPTSCEARRTSVAPAAAAISDSAMVAHLALVTPSVARRAMIWGSLWVLRWGRREAGLGARAIMRRRFSSTRSQRMRRAGEGMSAVLAGRGASMGQASSKTPSISAAMLPGSGPVPKALRAPMPHSSPKTAAKSSEQPLMTLGWS